VLHLTIPDKIAFATLMMMTEKEERQQIIRCYLHGLLTISIISRTSWAACTAPYWPGLPITR
jgi:hypothetical protein